MFPTSSAALFKAFPCPFYPQCQRGGSDNEPGCMYSHELAEQKLAARLKTPPPPPPARERTTRSAPDEPASDSPPRSLKKAKLEAPETNESPSLAPEPLPPSPAPAPTAADGSYRKLVTTAPRPSSIPSHSQAQAGSVTDLSQPPALPPDINSKIRMEQRRNALGLFFKEFKRLYASVLTGANANLAHLHALSQERALYAGSNKSSYIARASTIIKALRARAPARDTIDVGIDGEYQPEQSNEPSQLFEYADMEPLIVPVQLLREIGYPFFPNEPSSDTSQEPAGGTSKLTPQTPTEPAEAPPPSTSSAYPGADKAPEPAPSPDQSADDSASTHPPRTNDRLPDKIDPSPKSRAHVEENDSSKIFPLVPPPQSLNTTATIPGGTAEAPTPSTPTPRAKPHVFCSRCSVPFAPLYENLDSPPNHCSHHPGALRRPPKNTTSNSHDKVFTCCSGSAGDSGGCATAPWHVFKEDDWADLHARYPFERSGAVGGEPAQAPEPVVGVDCEMSYTTGGLALTRLTVVSPAGIPKAPPVPHVHGAPPVEPAAAPRSSFLPYTVLLDVMVVPPDPIVDYNTKYSGVSRESYEAPTLPVLPYAAARQAFGRLVGPKTVVVGHGLENDLKALRVVHERVIDTCAVWPHPRGWPIRYSLRVLAAEHLKKHIQTSALGHSSVEDSLTCLELLAHKIKLSE